MKDFELSDEWKSFLRGLRGALERCEEQRSTRAISEFLKTHLISAELWEQMMWPREKMLPDGLSQYAKAALNEAFEENPQLHLDTGNYLFLLLLYMKYQRPTTISGNLTRTWSTLKTWQLLQLGFSIDYERADAVGKSAFDLAKIWSDLVIRAGTLQEIPVPKALNIRYGRILVAEGDEGGYDYWMVFQKRFRSSETLSGMWHNINPINQTDRFLWSTNRNDILAASARQARNPLEYEDIAVTDSSDGSTIWIWGGDDWRKIGKIDIIQSGSEEIQWIRGVRVHPASTMNSISESFAVLKKIDVSKLVASNLIRIQELASSCIGAECSLSIDNETYVVTLHSSETEGRNVFETVVFERTQELVDFLRLPITTGSPVVVNDEDNSQYTWNPYVDIHYNSLDLIKPYVESKKPFISTKITLPRTARNLIRSATISINLKIKHDVHQCPIWLGIGENHTSCWVLKNKHDDEQDAISSILGIGLTDTEIGDILKTNNIYLRDNRYSVRIQFPENDERIVFRESSVFARHLCEKRVPPSSFLRLSEETLECTIFKESNLIIMTMKSDITGDTVYSGPLLRLSKDMNAQDALEHVEGVLESIIDSRYSSDMEINRIQFYDELLVKVNEMIMEYDAFIGKK